MKKKTRLTTLAGLALAAGAWHKFSGDTPAERPGPGPPPPELPGRFTECPEGQERKLIGGQWRCWPKAKPGGR